MHGRSSTADDYSSDSRPARLSPRHNPHRGGFRSWQDRLAWAILLLGLVLLNLPSTTLFGVTVPLQTVLLAPLRAGSGLLRQLAIDRSENERLSELAARLAVENARLRTLVRLVDDDAESAVIPGSSAGDLVQAPVIARDITSMQRYLIVSRGRRHGIQPGTPAIAPEGLVGKVIAAGSEQALVQTIMDIESRTAAQVVSSHPDTRPGGESAGLGLVRTDRSGRTRLDFVERDAEINPGDIIITSGLGGIFPRGLLIGRVTVSQANPADLFRYIELSPAAPISRLEYVYLVRITGRPTAADNSYDKNRGDGSSPWLENLAPREVVIPYENR